MMWALLFEDPLIRSVQSSGMFPERFLSWNSKCSVVDTLYFQKNDINERESFL